MARVKGRLSIGLALAATAVAAWFLVSPTRISGPEQSETGSAGKPVAPATVTRVQAVPGSESEKTAGMASAYAGLEAERKQLRDRLGLLRSQIWGIELPAEQAREASHEMMQAYDMLKNAPLLGAFSDAAQIAGEREKVRAANERLLKIQDEVASARRAAH